MKWPALLIVVALGLAVALFYVHDMPWVSEIPGWFYRPWDKAVSYGPDAVSALVAGVLGAAAATLLWLRGLRAVPALVLVMAATSLQLGATSVGGREELLRRHASGHGKYWKVVAERRGEWLDTLLDYERLARDRELDDYAPTKPPGVLLPYMAVDVVARWPVVSGAIAPYVAMAHADHRTADRAEPVALSILLFPLLTALVIPPLLLLGQVLFDDPVAAWGGAVLWATTPATLLVQYHLDGAVYPVIAVAGAALLAVGVRRDVLSWSALGGLVLVIGLYVSFSLVAGFGLAVGCAAAVAIDRGRRGEGGAAAGVLGAHLLVAAAAFAVGLALLVFGLRLDLLERWAYAMDYHARWKSAVDDDVWRWAALVEWTLYAGVPLVGVWLGRFAVAAARLIRGRLDPAEVGTVGLVALLVGLSVVSGTNEVSRMWAFLNPFVALSAATALPSMARARGRWWRGWPWPLLVLGLTQLAVALVMKAHQEW